MVVVAVVSLDAVPGVGSRHRPGDVAWFPGDRAHHLGDRPHHLGDRSHHLGDRPHHLGEGDGV